MMRHGISLNGRAYCCGRTIAFYIVKWGPRLMKFGAFFEAGKHADGALATAAHQNRACCVAQKTQNGENLAKNNRNAAKSDAYATAP
jgi:hypothetical protein